MFKSFLTKIAWLLILTIAIASCSEEEINPTEENIAFSSNDDNTYLFDFSNGKNPWADNGNYTLRIDADEKVRGVYVKSARTGDSWRRVDRKDGKGFDADAYLRNTAKLFNSDKKGLTAFAKGSHVYIVYNGKFAALRVDNGTVFRENGSFYGDASELSCIDIEGFPFEITEASFDNAHTRGKNAGKNAARPAKLSGIDSWRVPSCDDELKEVVVFDYAEGSNSATYEGYTFKSHAGRQFAIGLLIFEMADGTLHGYEVHNDGKVRGIRKQTWGQGGTAMHRTSLLSQMKKKTGLDYNYTGLDGLDIKGTVEGVDFVIQFGKVFYGRLWYGKAAGSVLIPDLPCGDITYKDVIYENKSVRSFDGVKAFQAPPAGSKPMLVQLFNNNNDGTYSYGGHTFDKTAGIAIFKIKNRLHGYEITPDCKLRGIRHQTWGNGGTAMHRLSLLSQIKRKHVSEGWRYKATGLDGLNIVGTVYHKSNKRVQEHWTLPFVQVFYGRMWYGKAQMKLTVNDIKCNSSVSVGTKVSVKVPANWGTGVSASAFQGTDLINLNNRSYEPVTFYIDYNQASGTDVEITVPARTDMKVKGEVGLSFKISSDATGNKLWQGTVNGCGV